MASLKLRDRSVVTKPVQRKRHTQRDQFLDNDSDDELFPTDANMNGAGDHDVADLQNIAARVGQEVDIFAETLDRFKDQLSRTATQIDAAVRLCISYRDYALDQVKKLKKQHQIRRLNDERDSFTKEAEKPFLGRAQSVASVKPSTEDAGHKSIRQWQAEADTWDLFRVALKSRYPSAEEPESCRARAEELGQPHKYMTSEELWQSFVLSDNTAKERHLVLKWLEQVAASDADIKQITNPDADKKNATPWTNGWMETRERIKGAKRMRIGTGNLDVRRSDSTDNLVSSLDPDAPTRQKRTLEKADAAAERAMWIACFDMLRQGKPWSEICAWCVERNQGWRALSLGVAGEEQTAVAGAGLASGALFRRMCLIAARAAGTDPYEAAVYGLLGGDVEIAKKACRSWNDHVFAQINGSLLAQYDRYVLGFQSLQLPLEFVRRNGLGDIGMAHAALTSKSLITGLTSVSSLSKEARSAYKLVQGSLIADTFHNLCLRVGAAVADEAFKDGTSVVIKAVRKQDPEELDEVAIVRDPDAFRIVAHALIVMRFLEQDAYDQRDEFDNVIAGYIQLLRSVGKTDPTPLYASMMNEDRGVASLAQVIADNQNATDAMAFLGIAQQYRIDPIAIIKGQCSYQLERVLKNGAGQTPSFKLLEPSSEELHPSRGIKLGALDSTLSMDDNALVRGLEIFHLVDGQWTVTFNSLATACRELLKAGHFATTRAIVDKVDFQRLSLNKSGSILGKSMDVMNDEEAKVPEDQSLQLQLMKQEAQAYYDVTVLVRATSALETWRDMEAKVILLKEKAGISPKQLRHARDIVSYCISLLFEGFLIEAKDDEEAATNASIRALYLPEVILSYLTLLNSAGTLVSRDSLLTAMDMATAIAADEHAGVRQAFVDGKRMTELLEMFAEVSKTMLALDPMKTGKRIKKDKEGRYLNIWDMMASAV